MAGQEIHSAASVPAPAQRAPVAGKPGLLTRALGGNTPLEGRKARWGYILITPWLIGLLLFYVGPMLASFYLSFTEYDISGTPTWIGLDNYQRAFTGDHLFWPSLGRTVLFVVLMVPISVTGSLLLALLLNQGLGMTSTFRTIFYLPYLTPSVAVAVIWVWLLHPSLGPVNHVLTTLGLPEFAWFSSQTTVIPSIVLMGLWATIGGTSMLVFLAGLQGVPQELKEAAEIDGAGVLSKFRNVTLPMITPVILFNLVLSSIGAFQEFTLVFVATEGGPAYGSWLFGLHIYQNAFAYLRLGYGSALAWILLVIIMMITLLYFGSSRRWVFYQGD
jgi:multiple sugar transport system permease protein